MKCQPRMNEDWADLLELIETISMKQLVELLAVV